ncbi:glycoside hydrolase family 3 protein [Nocardioides sp. SYSU D00038]|uniref:glycoside hydrolase family 3 protein n=1 Tax=Nocardioides sp. SYSU D00038 TaxID=2812554 RepID=UPI0019680884|nr:glycoside hydrolase family 3 protein [Nocardioides sp. SYSU D00038]
MPAPSRHPRLGVGLATALLGLATAVALTACTGTPEQQGVDGSVEAGAPAGVEAPAGQDGEAADEARTPAERAYARMTPEERVGQLFMFGVASTGPTEVQLLQLQAFGGGNAFLRGPSELGVEAMAELTAEVDDDATFAGVRPFISADQEGGNAQALEGPGFSQMPTALEQADLGRSGLKRAARGWARELLDAGVNLNLAPVADVVPPDVGTANEPIGFFHRQYGGTPDEVDPAIGAYVRGMQSVGVAAAVKHFPGLGRATGNTDSDPTATDPTTRRDPLLAPFRKGIKAGTDFVMVSSAHHPAIDPEARACFSPVVMRTMLREELGFGGVIISDSFGSASVADVRPGERAIRFLEAGGTMVLDTNSYDLEPMSRAVLARAEADPAFAELVRDNVMLVLETKARYGLVGD